MNAAIPITEVLPAGATPMRATFAMWGLGAGSESLRQTLNAATLDAAVAMATPPMTSLDHAKLGFAPFVILETDERAREGRARHMLHFYIVKAKRDWRSVGPCGSARKVAIPYAVHSGSLPMNAFDPRRPFDVAAGDDRVTGRHGGEPRLVEARR